MKREAKRQKTSFTIVRTLLIIVMFDAMQIGRVDLRKSGRHGRRINERISRDRNNADVLIFCIIHDDWTEGMRFASAA